MPCPAGQEDAGLSTFSGLRLFPPQVRAAHYLPACCLGETVGGREVGQAVGEKRVKHTIGNPGVPVASRPGRAA